MTNFRVCWGKPNAILDSCCARGGEKIPKVFAGCSFHQSESNQRSLNGTQGDVNNQGHLNLLIGIPGPLIGILKPLIGIPKQLIGTLKPLEGYQTLSKEFVCG